MAGATAEQKRAFVHEKAKELAVYMQTHGWTMAQTGAALVGLGAGWVAAQQGNEVAFQCLEMAKASIETHTTDTPKH